MIEEETEVKRTAVYPQVHHLEEQLVFPFISLFCHPFFSHTLHPPTTSHNCSLSHLYLITAESAAVIRPHHNTPCLFGLNTAEIIFTLRMNWRKKIIRAQAVRSTSQQKVKYYLWFSGYRLLLIVRTFYLYLKGNPNVALVDELKKKWLETRLF